MSKHTKSVRNKNEMNKLQAILNSKRHMSEETKRFVRCYMELGLNIFDVFDSNGGLDYKSTYKEDIKIYNDVKNKLDKGQKIPYDLKVKILKITKPELFNTDGKPLVDIDKLGNMEE